MPRSDRSWAWAVAGSSEAGGHVLRTLRDEMEVPWR